MKPLPAAVDAEPHRVNVWQCKDCRRRLICIDRHVGVTPFMMQCDPERTPGGCGGDMHSVFYRVTPPELWAGLATHEWYMPDESERERLRDIPGMLEHVMLGGLDIRPIARDGTMKGRPKRPEASELAVDRSRSTPNQSQETP